MAEEYIEDSGSDFTEYWIDRLLNMKGTEYLCDVDPEFIKDRFNLTGINAFIPNMGTIISFVTSTTDAYADREDLATLERYANLFYGLVHARYILTPRGLHKMLEKYQQADFGYCPRVGCSLQQLLPIGLDDFPRVNTVKLYCPKCEDLFNPKSSRLNKMDGAFIGTSFTAMFLQNYPHLLPIHPISKYVPTIFGFKVHSYAKMARWQGKQRIKYEKKLKSEYKIETNNCPGGYMTITDTAPSRIADIAI